MMFPLALALLLAQQETPAPVLPPPPAPVVLDPASATPTPARCHAAGDRLQALGGTMQNLLASMDAVAREGKAPADFATKRVSHQQRLDEVTGLAAQLLAKFRGAEPDPEDVELMRLVKGQALVDFGHACQAPPAAAE